MWREPESPVPRGCVNACIREFALEFLGSNVRVAAPDNHNRRSTCSAFGAYQSIAASVESTDERTYEFGIVPLDVRRSNSRNVFQRCRPGHGVQKTRWRKHVKRPSAQIGAQ
jgi:hypothetical protein